ncbi:hypothetical protein Bca4012_035327 [Brassica carinata]
MDKKSATGVEPSSASDDFDTKVNLEKQKDLIQNVERSEEEEEDEKLAKLLMSNLIPQKYGEGRFLGFGIVEFATPREAQKALEFRGRTLLGRQMRLEAVSLRGRRPVYSPQCSSSSSSGGWKAPETPPEKIIHRSLVEQCSRPIQKQLTTSDVRQNRLSISNSQVSKKCQQILDESGTKEIKFSVFGPDGKVHEIWQRSSFDLTKGWWTFVEEYGLKECCDFVTVWMFRHRVTQRICLAIDVTTFAFISKEVSKRISEAAFEDSD